MTSVELTRVSDVVVDDLTFDDLVRIALEEIPGASQGLWTLHGAVDPGISLLELFAWQMEQRLFNADQLTESTVRAVFRLLDVADPAPVRPARTVLSFTQPGSVQPLPAFTTVTLADSDLAVPFVLTDDVWVSPITEIEIDGGLHKPESVMTLTILRDLAPATPEVSLFVEIEEVPGIAAAYHHDAVNVTPPATLRWVAVGPGGSAEPVAPVDETGGLRRPGIVRFPWPAVWDEPGTGQNRITITLVDGFFTDAVAIRGIYPDVVVAVNHVPDSVDVSAQVATFLPLPNQVILLPPNAGDLTTGPGDVQLSVEERDGSIRTWLGVDSWLEVGPTDRVFLIDRARLVFGDGIVGRIPRPAAGASATVNFLASSGPAGSAAVGRAWIVASGPGTAVNRVPAIGTDAEDLSTAMQRAADALTAVDRTVTSADAVALALTTPGVGVARAHASAGFHPDFPCSTVSTALSVTVVPPSRRTAHPEFWTAAPQADRGLIEAVSRHLDYGRLLGQELFVLPPAYRRVTVWLSIANAVGDHVAPAISESLRVFLDPLRGGSEGSGWPFGAPVRPSSLLDVARKAAGRDASLVELSAALDDGLPSDCDDLEIGERELVMLEGLHISVNVNPQQSAGDGGGLQ